MYAHRSRVLCTCWSVSKLSISLRCPTHPTRNRQFTHFRIDEDIGGIYRMRRRHLQKQTNHWKNRNTFATLVLTLRCICKWEQEVQLRGALVCYSYKNRRRGDVKIETPQTKLQRICAVAQKANGTQGIIGDSRVSKDARKDAKLLKSGVNKSGNNVKCIHTPTVIFYWRKCARGNVKENDELSLLIVTKEATNVGYKVLKRREKIRRWRNNNKHVTFNCEPLS